MYIKQILPKVKANNSTYYNVDDKSKKQFKSLYNYLKKHKDKEIKSNVFQNNDALRNQINFWLNNQNELDYIKKYKAMELIAQNIIH